MGGLSKADFCALKHNGFEVVIKTELVNNLTYSCIRS